MSAQHRKIQVRFGAEAVVVSLMSPNDFAVAVGDDDSPVELAVSMQLF